MITKHTAGPWEHSGNQVVSGSQEICSMEERYIKGERKANARLIAAAPELLAALEACIADGFLAGEVLDQACTAIVRATGDQS